MIANHAARLSELLLLRATARGAALNTIDERIGVLGRELSIYGAAATGRHVKPGRRRK
jgi:hypothetical protein